MRRMSNYPYLVWNSQGLTRDHTDTSEKVANVCESYSVEIRRDNCAQPLLFPYGKWFFSLHFVTRYKMPSSPVKSRLSSVTAKRHNFVTWLRIRTVRGRVGGGCPLVGHPPHRRRKLGLSITPNFGDRGQSPSNPHKYKQNLVPHVKGQLRGQT